MPRVETDTNQVYRRKYFVSTESILGTKPPPKAKAKPAFNSIIGSGRVMVSSKAIPIRYGAPPMEEQIRVEVVKQGNEIKGLKITCPCGRHTELDVAYGASQN